MHCIFSLQRHINCRMRKSEIASVFRTSYYVILNDIMVQGIFAQSLMCLTQSGLKNQRRLTRELSVVLALSCNDPLHTGLSTLFLLEPSSPFLESAARKLRGRERWKKRSERKLFLCKVPRGLARGYEILMAHKM